ncbi:MAG: ribonuclease HII [Candidatus Diapherotrites archaeon]
MLIAGVDEAGRGPCLGPMVLAITTIDFREEEKLSNIGVKDSKLLSPAQRQTKFRELKCIVSEFGVEKVDVEELDRLMDRKSLNEIEAMRVAMLLDNLKEKPSVVFVDSPDVISHAFADRIRKYLSLDVVIRAEHKADLNYPIVAAASIIAKVERDREIEKLAKVYGDIGSGYSHDAVTINFIKKFIGENNKLPHFARRSWITSQRLMDERLQQKLV